ncbi:MAG: membrane protein insertase YidC [Melioribacter sp.]|uniref:membrane protein insertase YidC n=1 Tax=Melioribacter sp. TaxID=2052167 RepID=UPI003BED6CFB
MDRQSTIAFILIGVILVVWLYLNSPTPPPALPETTDSTLTAQDTLTAVEDTIPVEKAEEPEAKTEIAGEEILPFGTTRLPEKIITIDTKLARIELTSKGAKIRKYYLKNYETWYHEKFDENDFYNRHVQLINPDNGGDFNLIFVTKEGKLVNTSSLDFTSDAGNYFYKLEENDSLTLKYKFEGTDGKEIVKTFKFFGGDYAADIDIEFSNFQDVISSFRYDVAWTNGINFTEKNSVDEAYYSNAAVYAGGEQVIIDASSPDEKVSKDINGKVDWAGVKSKYFSVIISPNDPNDDGGAYVEGTHTVKGEDVREYYSVSLKVPFKNQSYQKDSFKLYIGPVEYNTLKTYGRSFEALVDFGSFLGLTFIIRPISEYFLLPLMKFLHQFIPNYGFVIILLSIIVKFALHPLTKQSMKSMKKMQLLQPKINELKEKYKDDPQRVQKETMKLYSTYGINPMGGCFPMLLQMPILIALWSLFNVAIDIRQQPFILWIDNLSAPDVIFKLPFKVPIFNIDVVSGLALLLGVTMFLQQKQSVRDPSQKALVYIMPVMFTLMFMGFPSGLNLYYFMFNLLSIVQQYYINHKKDDMELVPVANPKKKQGFMARMLEAAEKQAQTQKQIQSKSKKRKK